MKDLKRKYFTIDDFTGVFAISLVDNPAIDSDFQFFGKVEENFKIIDEEKRIVCGAIMIPEYWMLRQDEKTGEYYEAAFSEKTILEISQKYLKENHQRDNTIQHNFKVNDLCLVESWVVLDPKNDKTNVLNLKNINKGTWAGCIHIENDVWEEYVKTGLVKGFSVEGLFLTSFFNKNIELEKHIYNKCVEALNNNDVELINKIKSILF